MQHSTNRAGSIAQARFPAVRAAQPAQEPCFRTAPMVQIYGVAPHVAPVHGLVRGRVVRIGQDDGFHGAYDQGTYTSLRAFHAS